MVLSLGEFFVGCKPMSCRFVDLRFEREEVFIVI